MKEQIRKRESREGVTEVFNESIKVILVVEEAIGAADAVNVAPIEKELSELDTLCARPHRLCTDEVYNAEAYCRDAITNETKNR